MRYVFEFAEHEEHGFNGWKPLWIPNADPLGGMAVPHDILEHGRNDDGTIASEFVASGRCIRIRGDGCYWSRYTHQIHTEPATNIASDIPQLLDNSRYKDQEWPRIDDPRIRHTSIDEATEAIFLETIVRGIDNIRSDDPEEFENIRDMYFSPLQEKALIGLLRYGYLDAIKRYPEDPWETCHLFHRIEVAANKAAKDAQLGDRFIVTYVKSAKVLKVEHKHC